jgi:hypothetical protein
MLNVQSTVLILGIKGACSVTGSNPTQVYVSALFAPFALFSSSGSSTLPGRMTDLY